MSIFDVHSRHTQCIKCSLRAKARNAIYARPINTDDSAVFKALGIHFEGSFFILLTVIDIDTCNLKFGPSQNNILFNENFPYEKRGNHKMRILIDTEDPNGKSIHGYIDIAELRFGKTGTKINPHITYDGRKFDHGVVLRPAK